MEGSEPRIAAVRCWNTQRGSSCGGGAASGQMESVSWTRDGHAHQTLHLVLVQGTWSLLRHCATGWLWAEVRRRRNKGELVTRSQRQLRIAIISACREGGRGGSGSAARARICLFGGRTSAVHYRGGGTHIGEAFRPRLRAKSAGRAEASCRRVDTRTARGAKQSSKRKLGRSQPVAIFFSFTFRLFPQVARHQPRAMENEIPIKSQLQELRGPAAEGAPPADKKPCFPRWSYEIILRYLTPQYK